MPPTKSNNKEKWCNKCKRFIPLDSFNFRSKGPTFRSAYCKDCERRYHRIHSTTENRKRYILKFRYGISQEQYDQMQKQQDYKCWICDRKGVRKLAVDHDHKTGKVRGLLCQGCNVMLGYYSDVTKKWPNLTS